ncbi:MAG: phage portal protein [Phycisphaerales bacterium]|jgi:HK97 family phage portal protein
MITGWVSDYLVRGGQSEHPENTEAAALTERQDANIAIAIQRKSQALAWLPVTVQDVIIEDGHRSYEDNLDHPALDIIQNPNPWITKAELMVHFSASLDLTGNAFCQIEKLGDNINLWPIQTYRVNVKHTKDQKEITEYVVDENKETEYHLKPEEVLHIRYYNINNPLYGLSNIQPIERQILMDYYLEMYNKIYFKQGCSVSMIYAPGAGMQFTREQAEQLIEAFNKSHGGYKKAHKIFVPQYGGELKEGAQSHKDIQFEVLLKRNREKIFGVLGIPPSVAGIYEYANYANAKIQEETFWRHTLIPQLNIIKDALNRQILKRFYPEEDIVYKFDLSSVEALQADRLKEAQRLAILGRHYMPINRVLESLGQDPLDYEWAELPAAFALNEYRGFQNEVVGNLEAGATGQAGFALPGRSVKAAKYQRWKRYDDFLSAKERRYKKIIQGYFKGQSERLIDAIAKATAKGLWMRDWYYKLQIKEDTPDPKYISSIFDKDIENAYLVAEIESYLKDVILDSGDRVFGQYNVDLIFNVNSPEVDGVLTQLVNRSEKINNTTFNGIRNILIEGYENQWSLGQLEKEIRETFTQFSRVRSVRIARTEMLTAVNGGTQIGYQQAGVEKKEWLASLDISTRDSHFDLDGEVVRVDQPFTRGTWPMMYPGDPSAPPEEVINCRCTTIANFDD